MFAFKYSPRPGTRAAGLKDDIPREEKEERLARLLELNAKLWREKTQRLVGTVQDVLVEGASRKHILSFERSREDKMSSSSRPANARSKNNDMQLSGRTFANKIVNFAGNFEMVGHIVPVEITFAGPNSLRGEIKS
jgi:tRNA-2-methylthio-N6-dimethylallyladenosine synthase